MTIDTSEDFEKPGSARLDEEIAESFPASDPPGYTTAVAGGSSEGAGEAVMRRSAAPEALTSGVRRLAVSCGDYLRALWRTAVG